MTGQKKRNQLTVDLLDTARRWVEAEKKLRECDSIPESDPYGRRLVASMVEASSRGGLFDAAARWAGGPKWDGVKERLSEVERELDFIKHLLSLADTPEMAVSAIRLVLAPDQPVRRCATCEHGTASGDSIKCAWLKDAVDLLCGDAYVRVFVEPDHFCAAWKVRP